MKNEPSSAVQQLAPTGAIQTLNVVKDVAIDASIDIVWESILEECGPAGTGESGKPMPMKLEPWPGGRWFRDLGNNAGASTALGTGHLWAHVQVIKPPKLLELCGPLFMSYPALSHVQYRLVAEGNGTRLKLTHRAIGLIDPEHAKGVDQGWGEIIENIRKIAARRNASRR